jgi:hypothetical protein
MYSTIGYQASVDWLIRQLGEAASEGLTPRVNPERALAAVGLQPDVLSQLFAGESDLRSIPGEVPKGDDANTPSQGPQCTQAGCWTYGNCPSKYACSGEPGCR